MATLREALKIAKQEPQSERSQKLKQAILSGKMDSVAQKEGLDLEPFKNFHGKKTVEAPQFMQNAAKAITDAGTATPVVQERAENTQIGQTVDENAGVEETSNAQDVLDGKGLKVFQEGQDGIKGVATGGARRLAGFSDSGEKLIKTIGRVVTPKGLEDTFGFSKDKPTGAEVVTGGTGFKGTTGAEKVGATAVDLASIFAGGGAGRAVGGAASSKLAAKGLTGKAAQTAPKLVGESLGATTAFDISKNQELPNAKEAGAGLLIDAIATPVLSKTAGPLASKLASWIKETGLDKAAKGLKRAGFNLPDQNLIKELPESLRGTAKRMLDQAKERAERKVANGERVKEAMDIAADDLNVFGKTISTKVDDIGKQIGEEAKKLKGGVKLNTSSAADRLRESLESLNVKISKKGDLKFSGSDIEGITADEKIIQEAWDFVRKGNVDGRDALAKVRNLSNKLFAGKGEITASKRPINEVRAALREGLEELPGKYGELARDFSKLVEVESLLKKTTGDEGERAAEYIRRLYGRAPGRTQTSIELVQEIAEQFGIDEGKDIVLKTALADTIDAATGVTARQGFQGQIREGVESFIDKKGITRVAFDKIAEVLFRTPEKIDALEVFVEESSKPEVKNILGQALENLDGVPDVAKPTLQALRALFVDEATD